MNQPENTGRKQAGQFKRGQSGNPAGKPMGTRHKATLAAQALMDGEAEQLTRKAVELALAGDLTALRLCLERILPPRKSAPVVIDLPSMQSAHDIVKLQTAVLAAVGQGAITPDEAATLGTLGDNIRKAIETQEIEQRLTTLERATNKGGKNG